MVDDGILIEPRPRLICMLDNEELKWLFTRFRSQPELFPQGVLPKRKRIFMRIRDRTSVPPTTNKEEAEVLCNL
jgi:hypothetical protein